MPKASSAATCNWKKGNLRLSGLAEERYIDEDSHGWDGISTWNYESPKGFLEKQLGYGPAPLKTENGLYGLGLGIWIHPV